MADSNSEHLIRIIVQGVNRLGDVVDKGTRAVEKHTAAVGKQDKEIAKSARTAKDAQADFARLAKSIGDDAKDYESATFALKNLSAELDRFAKAAGVGTDASDDLHRSAVAARELAEQLKATREAEQKHKEAERKRAESEAKAKQKAIDDEVKANKKRLDDEERDNTKAEKQRAKAEQERVRAEAEVAKQRTRIENERQKEAVARAKAAADAQERILKELADLQIKEQERVEKERLRVETEAARERERVENERLERIRRQARERAGRSTVGQRVVGGQVANTLGQGVPIGAPSPEERPGTVVLGSGIPIDPTPRRTILQRLRSAVTGGNQSFSTIHRDTERFEALLGRLSGTSNRAGFSVARVTSSIRGMIVVGALAFSQQLISAFVALAAAALAVASAAAQAGAAIGGALVAGIGQAVPVVALLVASFKRIGAVFDAVKLFNKQAATSSYDQAQAADAQAAAADRVVSAQEGVVSAAQRVKDATDALTEAREKARQKIEDLTLAERRASLTQFQAGQAVNRAIQSGDVGALEGLRNQQSEADLALDRTGAEASEARSAGVGRASEVLDAVRNLDQANVALRRARREADAAGRAAERAATTGAAADRSLEQALALLSPAELALYEASKRIQARFKTFFRPVTDIIVSAFTRGVDRASAVLDDPRVLDTARNLSKAIGTAFDAFTVGATSDAGLDFFKIMGDEAARNLPLMTTLAIQINRIMANIAVAGGPALRKFIQFFIDLTARGAEATGSKSGLARLERFLNRGEEMAESFFHLAGAVIGLFAALAGAGGAEEGIGLVESLTASIQKATVWVQDHQDQVREFFSDVSKSTKAIAVAVYAVGKALVSLFSSAKVDSFAEAFREVLLPALVSASAALGTLVYLFTEFITLPGVSQLAAFALGVTLLFKAFSVFGTLLLKLASGLFRFIGPLARIGPLAIKMAGGLRIAAAVLSGPIGIAIAAVIIAITLLDRKFHFIGPTVKFIGEIFETVFNGIVDGTKYVIKGIGDLVGKLGFLGPILKTVGKLLAAAFAVTPLGMAIKLGGFIHDIDESKRAVERLKDAEDKLARSQREAASAQLALTDARRSARREINDLDASVRSGKIQVREAQFSLSDAEKELASLKAGGASKDEIARAELAVDSARENLRRTTISATRAEQDYASAKAKILKPVHDLEKATDRARKKRADDAKDLARENRETLKSKETFVAGISKLGIEGSLVGGLGKSLSVLNSEFDRSPSKIERIRSQVDKLKNRLSVLKSGTDEYHETAEKLRRKQRELNDAMGDADAKGKKGARGPRALGRSAANAAGIVDSSFVGIVKGFNKISGQLGDIKPIQYKATFDKTLLGAIAGGIEERATGGWINRKGGPQGPDNRFIRAGDGEAVLAVPHQPIVEQALKLRSAFMGGPGSLDEMFGRVKGYVGAFATGGRVGKRLPNVLGAKPGFAVFMQMFQRMFGRDLYVMSGSRPGSRVAGSGRISNHSDGNAIDISNPRSAGGTPSNPPPKTGLDRLYPYIRKHLPVLDLLWRTTQGGNHFNHVHWGAPSSVTATVDVARKFLAKIPGGASLGDLAGSIKAPKITGPSGFLRDLARRAVGNIAKAASRKLESAGPAVESFLGGAATGNVKAQGGDADVVQAFRRAISTTRAQPVERLALWMAGIVESGLRNLNYGDRDSLGALQERVSIFGRAHALNPFASAVRFLRDAISKRPWQGSAGSLAQAVQRSAFPERYDQVAGRARQYLERGGKVFGSGPVPATLHGDEHVWTAEEVAKAGGHKVMYALRKMLGGGGQGGPDGYQAGGAVFGGANIESILRKLVGGVLAALKGSIRVGFDQIIPDIGTRDASGGLSTALRSVARVQRSISRLRTRASNFARDFGRAIGQITDDNGLLDQATTALERLTSGMTRTLKRLAYRVTSSGLVVRRQSARQEADAQIPIVDRQLRGLRAIRDTAGDALEDTDRRLAALRKGGVSEKERKAYDTLRAARNALVGRIEALDGQIADTIEARFQAQERSIQAAVEEINSAAGRTLTRADLTDRMAAISDSIIGGAGVAAGMRASALNSRQGALVNQRDALLPLLARAQNQGNTSLANDLVGQIEELNVSIAENSAAITQNTVTARQTTVDAVARVASRASSRSDLADRVASIIEAAGNSAGAFALRGSTLTNRRGAITSQRDSLLNLLADAQNSFTGTVAQQQQIEDLIDQISDLNVQLDENTQAIENNTTAARQAAIDAIIGRGSFLGGVFSGLSGILKTLGAIAGSDDVGRIRDIIAATAVVLGQTGAGLREQLLAGFGVDLRGLDPSALVNALSGLNFDSITARLSVAQRQQFEALINAIIENASATVENTQQLSEINGTQQQSWSTTAWELFRTAIFNGSGGLLPQYRFDASMPQPITNSASSASAASGQGARPTRPGVEKGDTFQLNITSPTEVLDPAHAATVWSFMRSTNRAT